MATKRYLVIAANDEGDYVEDEVYASSELQAASDVANGVEGTPLLGRGAGFYYAVDFVKVKKFEFVQSKCFIVEEEEES